MQNTFEALSMLTPTASCQSQVKGLEVTMPTRGEAMMDAVLLLKAGLCFLLPRDIAAVTVSSTANVCPLAWLSCDVPSGCGPWAFVHIRLLSIVFPSDHAAQNSKVLKTEQYKEPLF